MIRSCEGLTERNNIARFGYYDIVNIHPYRAVIFDLNNTLDKGTTYGWHCAAREVGAMYGMEIPDSLYGASKMPNKLGEMIQNVPVEVLKQQYHDAFSQWMEGNIAPMPGAVDLARFLNEKFLLAIATSSPAWAAEKTLSIFGIRECFKAIIAGRDVAAGKPAPDIYLKAADTLGVQPKECIVFEDAVTGVKAAKDAGMTCIALPTREQHHDPRFVIADWKASSFHEVNFNLIAGLASRVRNR